MRDLTELFAALQRSRFRRGIRMTSGDQKYLNAKSWDVMQQHARQFIWKRLADAHPYNDGRQTPWCGHPVFSAQHATGTCCRKCLSQWHHIPPGRPLSEEEVEYIVRVIDAWLVGYRNSSSGPEMIQDRTLFETKGNGSP